MLLRFFKRTLTQLPIFMGCFCSACLKKTATGSSTYGLTTDVYNVVNKGTGLSEPLFVTGIAHHPAVYSLQYNVSFTIFSCIGIIAAKAAFPNLLRRVSYQYFRDNIFLNGIQKDMTAVLKGENPHPWMEPYYCYNCGKPTVS